jgi:DNA sulfur modification protein DndB
MWEGRTMHQGKIKKARHNIVLTTNILKQKLGLPLDEKEQEIENQFLSTLGGGPNR